MELEKLFPLTLPQQDIYFEQLLCPELVIYNIGAKIEIRGVLDIDILKEAYKYLIDQHDAYRIVLQSKENEPHFKILEKHHSELGFVDFSSEPNGKEIALKFIKSKFKTPFDLSKGELLHRFILIRVSSRFHYLFSVYHHIITDGWGTSLMFQRLVRNYNELTEFDEIQSAYPYAYTAFFHDDLTYQNSEEFESDKEFWKNKFSNLPDSIIPLIGEKRNSSQRKELFLSRPFYNQINGLAKELKVSTLHIILGVLYVYFGRFYQNGDLAIGLPVLNRGKSAFKKTVGLFMGVAPLRINVDFENSFKELVLQIKNQLRQDYRHQRFPLGKLIQELNLFQEKDRLFNVTVSYEKQNYSDHFNGTSTKVVPLSHNSERVALAVYIREFDEREDVKIDFDYNVSYFTKESITQFVQTFEYITNQVLSDFEQNIKNIKLLTRKSFHQVVDDFNETTTSHPQKDTVIDVFNTQAHLYSYKVAVDDGQIQLSYKDLHELSQRIALYIEAHVSINKPIAVLLNRSSFLVAVLMGVMKSGRPFIPLDPGFPQERLNYIVKHSQCDCIIMDTKLSSQFDFDNTTIIDLTQLMAYQKTNHTLKYPKANDSAYIIYTSGSTGRPKGVEIGHLSLLNFLSSMKSLPGISDGDVIYAVTTYSFDISILELFLPLISGASVYIARESVLSEPIKIIEELSRINPSIIQATPSFYQMLFNAGWHGDKNQKILCGGDLISESLAKRMITTSKEVWNMYGPTETTIWSSIKQITIPSDARNIGKPIANTSFYILDKWLNPVPIGAVGDIYVGGSGLAKGYFLDEKLTANRFITSPFKSDGRIYFTGDIGKWTNNGEVIFLGRNDNQVKIRGYRIELEEIEKKVIQIPSIHDVVVVVAKSNEDARLVAYIIADAEYDEKFAMDFLRNSLPDYMIPKIIIPITAFPVTPNNKVDRKKLASKAIQFHQKEVIDLPKGELEEKIYILWKNTLQFSEFSTTDNFFRLGGHSLSAVQLVHKINTEFATNLNQSDIFNYPTIKLLCGKISEGITSYVTIPKSEEKDYYDVTYSQKNIWMASQIKDVSIAYNMNAAYEIEGPLNIEVLNASFLKIISRYEILRTNFVEIYGAPKQIIKPTDEISFKIDEIHLKGGSTIPDLIRSFNNKEYDLGNESLIRVQIIHKTKSQFVLCFSAHHIIMDGWSMEIFIEELKGNYNSILNLENTFEKKLDIQFRDYSEWINTHESTDEAKAFWKENLNGYEPKNLFKKDYDKRTSSFTGARYSFSVSSEITDFVKEIAQENATTDFSVLCSLFSLFIYQLSSFKDVCIGTVTSGRTIDALSHQVGMFVNTIPLRLQINQNKSIKENINEIKNKVNQSIQYDNFPIAEVFPNYSQLFNVLLVYQNPEGTVNKLSDFEGLKIRPITSRLHFSRFPITFNIFYEHNKFNCDLEYNINMYAQETIVYLVEKFKKLLNEVMMSPSKIVSDYDITLDEEKSMDQKIDIDFNF